MIKFIHSDIDGFASIRKETFHWDKPGLNIIQAPNGNGKSKFIDALCWCLFGTSLSGSVEPWEHKKYKKYQGTMVKTAFETEAGYYTVIRCKDYKGEVYGAKGANRLELLVDGNRITNKKKIEIQVEINNMLGYSFNLFINSIIFGQKIKRLITETGPNKKKVFEEAFEMSYIPKAKKIIEEEKKTIELTYYKHKAKVEAILEKLEDKKEALTSEQEMVDSFEEDKRKEIKVYQDEIDENEGEIETETPTMSFDGLTLLLKKANKKVSKLNETQLNKDIGKAESEVERLFDDMGNLQGVIGMAGDPEEDGLLEACPHCNRKYTSKDKKDEIKRNHNHIDKLESDLLEMNNQYDIAKGNLNLLELDMSSITTLKESILSYEEQLKILESIKILEDESESLRAKIEVVKQKSLKNSTKKYTRDIKRLKKDLKPEKKSLKKLKEDLAIKKWLIEDPLSNNGLKAFIFNMMLDKLNEKLTYYSKFIPFKVLFDLDMDSHNKNIDTYVMQGDNPVPFEDLSGGQQQAVNIATAFAVHDIVSEGKDCNLLIMDELFESLDKSNVEIMSELIQDKANDKSLFLITHNPEFTPTNANIINVYYNKGFTSLSA